MSEWFKKVMKELNEANEHIMIANVHVAWWQQILATPYKSQR